MRFLVWVGWLSMYAGILSAQNPAVASFPGSVATDTVLGVACNSAHSSLTANIGSSDTTIPVANGNIFCAPSYVTIDSETIKICSTSTNSLTVCSNGRATHGTAVSHTSSTTVDGFVDQNYINQSNAEIKAIENGLGANFSNVAILNNSNAFLGGLTSTLGFNVVSAPAANSYKENCLLAYGGVDQFCMATSGNAYTGSLSWVPTTQAADYLYNPAGSPMFIGFGSSANSYTEFTSAGTYFMSGSVGVGTITPDADLSLVHSGANSMVNSTAYGTGVSALVTLRSARGTSTSPSAVQSGDNIGRFQFQAYGATGFSTRRAALLGWAAENWTDTAQGAYLTFETTAAGTTQFLERMRIDQNGNMGIGTPSPGTARLNIVGQTSDNTSYGLLVQNKSGTSLLTVRDDAAIGLGGPTSITGTAAALSINPDSSHAAGITLSSQNTQTTGGSVVYFLGGNNSTYPGSGANLGTLDFRNLSWGQGAYIGAFSVEGQNSSSAASSLLFATTPSGATVSTPRFVIGSNGNVGIGTGSTVPPYLLQVNGSSDVNVGIFEQYMSSKGALYLQNASGQNRWAESLTSSESGSNVGSDYTLTSYSDSGSFLGNPLSITRSTGAANFSGNVNIQGLLTGNAAAKVPNGYTHDASWTWIDNNTALPTGTGYIQWGVFTPMAAAITITGVECSADTSDAVIQLRNSNGNDFISSNLACGSGTAWSSTTSLTANAALSLGQSVGMYAVSGTAKRIAVAITYNTSY